MSALDLIEDILRPYVRGKLPGETLDYVTVQQETGVSMTVSSGNRRALWSALRREKIQYRTVRDSAVVLASATNAAGIVATDTMRLLRKAKRNGKRASVLATKFSGSPEMPEGDRKQLFATVGFYGALEIIGSQALAARPIDPSTPPPKPMLPMFRKT